MEGGVAPRGGAARAPNGAASYLWAPLPEFRNPTRYPVHGFLRFWPESRRSALMANHSTLAILPHITKIGYDPEKDLAPIALILAAPNVAIVKSALPVTSMGDLVAYGKINRLTNATQGIGASGHLIGEQFKQLTGVEVPEVRERLSKQGLQLPLGSPEEFAVLIAAESKRWGEVIRTGGIKLESN